MHEAMRSERFVDIEQKEIDAGERRVGERA
jgi:hypothetical protein